MKKTALLTALMLVVSLCLAPNVYAKDLEPCHHCGGTGRYDCLNCHNEVWIACDLCSGEKTIVCGECSGAGYFTCPSCSGDGYTRSGNGEIPPDAAPGSCGQCGGSGKLECLACRGAGAVECNRCLGAGGRECDKDECLVARAHDWKCPFCMGTGYLLTNFWPGENDGVQNMPAAGDLIWESGKSTPFGGAEQIENPQPQPDPEPQPNPEPQPDPEPQSDPQPSDDPHSSDDPTPIDDPAPIDEPEEDYSEIFVEPERMTGEERDIFEALDEAERRAALGKAAAIISTAEPQSAGEALGAVLESIVKRSGADSMEEARIMPIGFSGRLELGFPVRITVSVPQGALDGGRNIAVFRAVEEDGEIKSLESLGRAEYRTYPDGSVSEISFLATGLSEVFTISEELSSSVSLSKAEAPESAESTPGALIAEKPEAPGWMIPAAAVFAVAAVAAAAALIVKKKG